MEKLIYLQTFILFCYVIFTIIKEKGLKLYNPAILLSTIYFFEFGLPNLTMLSNPADQLFVYNLRVNDLNKGLLFFNLVFILFLLGYYSPYYNKDLKSLVANLITKLPQLSNYKIEIKNFPLVIIGLLILGWISRILVYKAGMYYHTEVGYDPPETPKGFMLIGQYITVGAMFPLIALALIFIEWMKNQRKVTYLFLIIVLVIIEFLYALPTGSKERVVLPIAILVFIYSLRSKLPLVPLLISSALFVLFVFPFNAIYRNIFLTGDIIRDLSVTYHLYSSLFSGTNLETLKEILIATQADRLNYALIVDLIIRDTPYIWDFKLGYSYLFFLLSLIPRIIWHNKPNISIFANDFGRDYGLLYPTDYTTSMDVTWVGEMFLNFGWYGIFVGFFYGLLFQIIYSYFLRVKILTAPSAILYALSLYYMIRGGMFAVQFSGLVKIFIIVLLILYPFLRRVNQKQ